jgi:DNA-binding NarL/FixJ family response regulator
MLRVAVLDDHPAVLSGLERLIRCTDGFEPVIVARRGDELLRQLGTTRVDLAVLDYVLADGDGLTCCQRLKERMRAPAVVVYSAYESPRLAVAARIAGADALIDKRAPVHELIDAMRRVGDGEVVFPEISPDVRLDAFTGLDPRDLATASMRLAGTSYQGVAEALGTDRVGVSRSVGRILKEVRPRPSLERWSEPRGEPVTTGGRW